MKNLTLVNLAAKINSTLNTDPSVSGVLEAIVHPMPDGEGQVLALTVTGHGLQVDYRAAKKDKDIFRIFENLVAKTPDEHIKEALNHATRNQTSPFDLPTALIASVLVNNLLTEEELKFIRSNNLEVLCRLAKAERSQKPSPGPGERWNVELLSTLVKLTNYPDKQVAEALREGFPLTGKIPDGGTFPPSDKNIKVSRKPKLDEKHKEAVENFLKNIAERSADDNEEALEKEVKEEIQVGWAEGPYDMRSQEISPQFISPKFSIVQGDKVRVIDHLSFREHGSKWGPSLNSSAEVKHRVNMPRMGHIDEMLRRIHGIENYSMLKVDHQNAYKQIKIKESDRLMAVTAYRSKGRTLMTIPKVLPFGGVGSVTAYLRVAMLHCFLMQTLMFCMVLSYMDDFFGCCKRSDWAAESVIVFNDLITGAVLKNKKTVLDKEVDLLGLIVSVTRSGAVLKLPHSKRQSLLEAINQAFKSRYLDKKLAGRLNFVVESMTGRTGRALSSVLVRHGGDVKMTFEVENCLREMVILLNSVVETRKLGCPLNAGRTFCVYTDAEGSGGAGILVPKQQNVEGIFSAFSITLGPSWSKRETDIIPLELIAAVSGIVTAVHWLKLSSDDSIVLYVDNSTTEVILGQGKSKILDLNGVSGKLWREIAVGALPQLYLARVETKLNPADAPSRRDLSKPYLEGLWVRPPVLPSFCDAKIENIYE
jgi:hypothetical protein